MYGKPEHRPRITDYQYVMALVQSGGLAVYGRFLHCPLFRAICGAWAATKVGPGQKSRPGQPYADRRAVFMRFTLGISRRSRRPSRREVPTLLIDGMKIAERGLPGTAQADTWIMLKPGWMVRDVKGGTAIQVSYEHAWMH